MFSSFSHRSSTDEIQEKTILASDNTDEVERNNPNQNINVLCP